VQIAIEITGVDEFVAKMRRIADVRTQQRIMKATIQSGANPLKTAMRRQIRAVGAVRKGILYKAVTRAFRVYSSGVAWLGVGIRDRKVDGENPGKYFHLVDLGSKAHTIHRRKPIRVQRIQLGGRWYIPDPKQPDGGWYTLQGPYLHPGAKAKPIREPALKAGQSRVAPQMAKTFARQMEREAAKMR